MTGTSFFAISFYFLYSVTIDVIGDQPTSRNCPQASSLHSGIVNTEFLFNKDLSNRVQDLKSEVGPNNTTELQIDGDEEDRVSVNAENNCFLL